MAEPVHFTTTKDKHELKLRPFPPQRLNKEARDITLRHGHINTKTMQEKSEGDENDFSIDDMNLDDVPATTLSEIEELMIRYLVIEIDGYKANDAFEYIMMDVHPQAYDEIREKCDEIHRNSELGEDEKKE